MYLLNLLNELLNYNFNSLKAIFLTALKKFCERISIPSIEKCMLSTKYLSSLGINFALSISKRFSSIAIAYYFIFFFNYFLISEVDFVIFYTII